ncbi:MAG: hypoxanthine phosphoribosyltransferase [Gaiellales bacterium]|nr:hypoxanthine phosphoribosyltransferase [Gaiellales bacterium]
MTVTVETVAQPEPGEIVYSAGLIAARVAELGRRISGDYHDRNLVLVTVLKGSTVFLADLSRQITIPHRLEFMAISAYRGSVTASSGRIRLLKDVDRPVRDDHVLIVEEIVDTGLTLNYLFKTLRFRGAASVEVCTLLDRPYRRLIEIEPRYIGFTAPDDFLIGYGFDHRQRFRNLPDIRLLAR